MKYIGIALGLFLMTISCTNETQDRTPNKSVDLNQLYESYTFPEWATYEGIHDYNDRLNPQSMEAGEVYLDSIAGFLEVLEQADKTSLSPNEVLNYDLFHYQLSSTLERYAHEASDYLGFTQQGGYHITFPQLSRVHPINTEEDVRDLFVRLKAFPGEIDHVIDMLKAGLEAEVVQACPISEQVLDQLEGLATAPVEQSPFYTMTEKHDLLAAEIEELSEILANEVQPAYMRLFTFYRDEYHVACRTDIGVSSVKGGKDYYEYLARYYTNSNMTPDEIFQIGMQEVERIKLEMIKTQEDMGYGAMDRDSFFSFLRTDDQFYFKEKDKLMERYHEILDQMDEQLPALFGELPETPYDLHEIEAYRAKAAPAAYYYSAPADGSRPGYFYVNTYNLKARPIYTMTALALHEAVPGHHLQIALASEMEEVPWFRNNMQVTAFVEGWGLYAEYLGYESGMYEDPVQRIGALSFEMWRACRLVVDVGIHYKDWSRGEAIIFLKGNAPLSESDIHSEVDRYIAWPGQALAYKIGELEIKRLRAKAEEALGEQFDIKAFHDEVLDYGSIPLSLLAENIDQWIESRQ